MLVKYVLSFESRKCRADKCLTKIQVLKWWLTNGVVDKEYASTRINSTSFMTGPWTIDPFVFNFDMYNYQG